MRHIFTITFVSALVFVGAGTFAAGAASLRVAPVGLRLTAPTAAGSITLRNEGNRPINVQVRPFRWLQKDGKDVLEATREVVVSPPISTLAPGTDYVVRIVRLAKGAVTGEEAYRLIIDELPDPARRRGGNVSVLLRYSVPVFFSAPQAEPAHIGWRLETDGKELRLSADNSGDKHLRLANLKMKVPEGPTMPLRDGLIGYVLGRSEMQWRFNVRLPKSGPREVTLTGESSEGELDVAVAVGDAR